MAKIVSPDADALMSVGDSRTCVEKRELALLFIGCGALMIVQSVLALWHFAPSMYEVWSLVFWRSISAFWICGFAALAIAACALTNRREGLLIFVVALIAFIISFALHVGEENLAPRLLESAKWPGLVGLLAFAVQATQQRDGRRLLTAVCFSLFVPISTAYLTVTYTARPQTMDLYAYIFDLASGRVAPYFFTLFERSATVSTIASAAYVSVLGAYVILFALQEQIIDRQVVPALRIFLIAAVLGFICYFIFPVVGPVNFFGDAYPLHMPDFEDFNAVLAPARVTARNGMPSLHFTWALLLVVNVPRRLVYARAAFLLFALLTIMATLGSGEHYFVDLVAALPFAALCQGIGRWLGDKHANHLWSTVRSVVLFIAFLTLLVASPAWLHFAAAAWAITTTLAIAFFLEMRHLSAN